LLYLELGIKRYQFHHPTTQKKTTSPGPQKPSFPLVSAQKPRTDRSRPKTFFKKKLQLGVHLLLFETADNKSCPHTYIKRKFGRVCMG
jgi:hypothetical protein